MSRAGLTPSFAMDTSGLQPPCKRQKPGEDDGRMTEREQ